MHCLGNIIYAAQVDFDRALRMIVLDHLIDKGDEMFLEHREGTGVEVAISIDRHPDLLALQTRRVGD
jgi:hypothetical protein